MKKQALSKHSNRLYFRSRTKFGMTDGLVLLLVFLLPTQLGRHFFSDFSYLSGLRVDYLAPTLYLTDIIAIFLIILNFKKVVDFFKNKNFRLFAFLFALNILFSFSKPLAIYRFLKIVELLAVFAVFSRYKSDKKILNYGILAGSAFTALLAILQFVKKESLQGIFYFFGERNVNLSMANIAKASLNGVEILRPYATFSHPNSMAGFYLLIYFFVLTNKKVGGILKNTILFLSTLIIFISFSKITISIFIFLNIIWLIVNIKKLECKICSFSKVLVLFFLSLVFTQTKGDPLSLEKRTALIMNAQKIIASNPAFGVGLGNYLIVQNKFPNTFSYFLPQPVHNIFLLFLSEAGVFTFIFFIYFFIQSFREQFRKQAFLFCLGVIVLTGLFDHYWITLQQNFLLMAVLLGEITKD